MAASIAGVIQLMAVKRSTCPNQSDLRDHVDRMPKHKDPLITSIGTIGTCDKIKQIKAAAAIA